MTGTGTMTMPKFIAIVFMASLVLVSPKAHALTVDEVITLTILGYAPGEIIKSIKIDRTVYRLSDSDVEALKKASVDTRVIAFMKETSLRSDDVKQPATRAKSVSSRAPALYRTLFEQGRVFRYTYGYANGAEDIDVSGPLWCRITDARVHEGQAASLVLCKRGGESPNIGPAGFAFMANSQGLRMQALSDSSAYPSAVYRQVMRNSPILPAKPRTQRGWVSKTRWTAPNGKKHTAWCSDDRDDSVVDEEEEEEHDDESGYAVLCFVAGYGLVSVDKLDPGCCGAEETFVFVGTSEAVSMAAGTECGKYIACCYGIRAAMAGCQQMVDTIEAGYYHSKAKVERGCKQGRAALAQKPNAPAACK